MAFCVVAFVPLDGMFASTYGLLNPLYGVYEQRVKQMSQYSTNLMDLPYHDVLQRFNEIGASRTRKVIARKIEPNAMSAQERHAEDTIEST